MQPKGQVRFIPKDRSLFFPTLKKRVESYFKEQNLSRNANAAMVLKTVILFSAYFGSLAAFIVFAPSFGLGMLLWAIMGLAMAGIGMSVMHDANHGAYSSNEKVNKYLSYTLNLIGGSVFNWRLQHNILHHTYTNIVHMDDDIADKLILRFSPHTETKKYHKLQYLYAFFFYAITTLYWVTAKDFMQFSRYTRNGVNNERKPGRNRLTLLRIAGAKLVYFSLFAGLPLALGLPWLHVLCGFLVMHLISGLVLTIIFQLAHTVEGTTHPLPCPQGKIENDWAIHQMNTTVNFARGNKVLSWYVGGLNFQVEHHLFPRICHVHYPKIAPIVKATAEEFGIPYLENPTFSIALSSHVATLRRLGTLPDLDEAIG